jgi:uncharacterized membrane protein YgcG
VLIVKNHATVFVLQQERPLEIEERPSVFNEVISELNLQNLQTVIQGLLAQDKVIDLTVDVSINLQKMQEEVRMQCWQIFQEISFSKGKTNGVALKFQAKHSLNLLQGLTLSQFRMQHLQNPRWGAKEVIQNLLSDVTQQLQGSSLDSLSQLQRWIFAHRVPEATPAGSLAVVPETIISSEITWRALVTLQDGRWINSQILNFYIVQHSLCTGACCDQFPQPLSGGPTVFYADTYFLHAYPMSKRRWKHSLGNYDFMVIPAFVNDNHYVTFLVKLASHELVSYDSLGDGQAHLLEMLRQWLVNENQEPWTTRAGDCPQQDNSDDCLVFALLCGSYAHLSEDLSRPLSECYSQQDISRLRLQLVHLAVTVGNIVREGNAWTPFQNPGGGSGGGSHQDLAFHSGCSGGSGSGSGDSGGGGGACGDMGCGPEVRAAVQVGEGGGGGCPEEQLHVRCRCYGPTGTSLVTAKLQRRGVG